MLLLSLCWQCVFLGLLLLITANGSPVIIRKILSERLLIPIDNGCILKDGYRLLGSTKTWAQTPRSLGF